MTMLLMLLDTLFRLIKYLHLPLQMTFGRNRLRGDNTLTRWGDLVTLDLDNNDEETELCDKLLILLNAPSVNPNHAITACFSYVITACEAYKVPFEALEGKMKFVLDQYKDNLSKGRINAFRVN